MKPPSQIEIHEEPQDDVVADMDAVLDNFDTPVATREGRPKALNKPPPNKRDTPFGNDTPAADDGKFVININ
jgi:hypothetical protein